MTVDVRSLVRVLGVVAVAGLTAGKVYERCELARELRFVHSAPDRQLATWVCIAEHESQYNTSVVGHLSGDGSGDHGIFQISDLYWCSPPGKGYACGVTCAELEDDDISDDFLCAQRIYREHKQLSGDGFNAWAVYTPHCKGPKADRYIKDCFSESERPKPLSAPAAAFAHGFFGTAAGGGSKGFSAENEVLSFTPPEVADQPFVFTSPEISFANNQFSKSTDSFHLFTPSSQFTPFTTASPPTTAASLIAFRPTSVTPTPGRSIFNFGSTFTTPSTTLFLTPTTHQTTPGGQPAPKPVFVINGVQWV